MFGIFDSGVGGLSVYRLLEEVFPKAGFIYLGDTAHFPYGEKSEDAIKNFSLKNADFLISHGANIIIIACHTASALASKTLERQFNKKGIKIYNVITPTIEEISHNHIKRLGVIGTRGMIQSGTYAKRLEGKGIEVIGQACPLLVSLIEEGWTDRPETFSITKHYLEPLKEKEIDALVLSCTHYSLIRPMIEKIIGSADIKVIDPAKVLIKLLKQEIINKKIIIDSNNKTKEFWVTDFPTKFQALSRVFLKSEVNVKMVNLGL
ncbi:MAG: glutamate racemase [Candidatus Paceibacterota bacterium]|jgi:glutamate racemase